MLEFDRIVVYSEPDLSSLSGPSKFAATVA